MTTRRPLRVAVLALWTLGWLPSLSTCPSREFIYPCTCMQTFVGSYVMCSGIDNEYALRLPFQYLRDYNITRLLLTNFNLSVPPTLFSGLKIGTLKVVDSRFKVEDGQLDFLSSQGRTTKVVVLEFMRSVVDAGTGFFGNLDLLEALNMQNSTFRRLGRDWLSTLVNLTQLSVDSTHFQSLDHDALADLPRLVTLTWTNNDVREVKREFFPKRARFLSTLDLR